MHQLGAFSSYELIILHITFFEFTLDLFFEFFQLHFDSVIYIPILEVFLSKKCCLGLPFIRLVSNQIFLALRLHVPFVSTGSDISAMREF